MLSKSEFERNEDTDGDQMVAVYLIDEGQCRPCPHRWTRVTYKWDGSNYKKIKSEETKEVSDVNTPPSW
jgi:hypothetical protein